MMFEHWISAAPGFSTRVGVDTDTMIRSHDAVCSMMGVEWIDEHCRGSDRTTRSIADAHPLALALTGRTEQCNLDVLHVAAYLCAFRSDDGVAEIISSLRDPSKYWPTLFELALAWTFRIGGAEISLFPSTPKGVGDLAAIVDGNTHVIEASGFPSDPLRDDGVSFVNAMAGTLHGTLQKAEIYAPVSLELDIDEVSGSIRADAHAAVRDIVRLFRDAGSDKRIFQPYDFGDIALRPQLGGEGPSGEDRWTMAMRIGGTPLDQSKLFGATEYAIRHGGHWIYLCDRAAGADPETRLRAKLKRESRQVSGCKDAVIILDIEALGVDVINDRARLAAIAQDFARKHTSTTGIGFVVQAEQMNGRRGISGHYFALKPSALSEGAWKRIVDEAEGKDLFDELAFIAKR